MNRNVQCQAPLNIRIKRKIQYILIFSDTAERLLFESQSHYTVWISKKVRKVSLYLIGSDRKQRPHARRAFCQRLRAAMARLNVTGIGLSPRWNLQNGTCPACLDRKNIKNKKFLYIYICICKYKSNVAMWAIPIFSFLLLCVFYLFEGLPKLSSWSHAQLLCDVSWNF